MHNARTACFSIIISGIFAISLMLLFFGRPVMAQDAAERAQTVLIQFAPDVTEEQRMARIAALGGELVDWMPQIQVAEVRLAGAGVQVAAVALAASPEIVFMESDMPVHGVAISDDPAFDSAATSYGFDRIQAPAAWEITIGRAEVIVAVVDSGIKLDHPELAGQLVAGYDFVNKTEIADDDSGHGTHVAGVIGAAMNNQQGLAGVCPNCRLMPIKVLNNFDQGTWGNLARGILFAVDHGADVINLSLGSPYPSKTLEDAILYARRHDVVMIAAAGNYAVEQPIYPAALDGVIAVSATTPQDGWWELSNYGSFVDLSAPGDLIYSTYHRFDNTFGGYTYMSGTSMATPFVSGLVGLMLSLDPRLDPEEVADLLNTGADDLGDAGYDPYFGHGRVNAYRTLSLVAQSLSPATGDGALRLYLPAIQSR